MINVIKGELAELENMQEIISRNVKMTIDNILLILEQDAEEVDVLEEALELHHLNVEKFYIKRAKKVLADATRKLEVQNE